MGTTGPRIAAVLLAIGAIAGAARGGGGPPGPTSAPLVEVIDGSPSSEAGGSDGGPSRSRGPAGCRTPWDRPVDAPVRDGFRPPSRPYGPGNRGIEYDSSPGDPVRAVDAGTVTFAGPVGGFPVVVIDHGAGLRSSSVRLLDAAVGRGDPVARGQLIGRADVGFHLGARRGSHYLDPAELLERRCQVVRLVPIP